MEEFGSKNMNDNLNFKNTTLNIKKREIIINKFIEKFPKTKLYTIVQLNKDYNKNIELDENFFNFILDNKNCNYLQIQN